MQGIPKVYSKLRLVKIKEGAKMYCMGETKFRAVARDAGAIIKINQTTLIDLDIFEKYLETFRVPPETYY